MKDRALRLGWQDENIDVIDEDPGQSGSSAEGRSGFQQLVSDVALGKVGAVLGLEVSRLARSCSDWYRLLEVAALSGALIALQIVFFGEDGLRHALKEYVTHYHEERNHQGIGNVIPFPNPKYESTALTDEIKCKTRLGGLLNFYYREAA